MNVFNASGGATQRPSAIRLTNRVVITVCAMVVSCAALSVSWAAEPKGTSDADYERQLNEARRRLDEAARQVAELSRKISEEAMPRVAEAMNRQGSRAMLGVGVGAPHHEEHKEGVEILSVSPGGPAAEAGLKAGDVLTEIKGQSLKPQGNEKPQEKLMAIMREVEHDEKVKVRYLRDGKVASATVIARRMDPMMTMPLRELERFPGLAYMRSSGAFGAAELVAMTPKLAQYFGTDEGLLVVRAPADIRLKLEEGDVLLDIDGRVPTSPAHALRILGSYQAGETLKLSVMRMKKRMQLEITIPEDVLEHRFDSAPPKDYATPPAPPAPPPPRDRTAK